MSRFGFKHSEETKEKIRKSLIGHSVSKNTVEKLRLANLGRKHSGEENHKNRIAQLKRFSSIPLIRHKKICIGCGVEFSTKKKEKKYCSLGCYQKTNKEKFSKYLPNRKGVKFSDEHRFKISKARKGQQNALGRKVSDETRAKLRASNKRAMLGRFGELSPRWKGGITEVNKMIRSMKEYYDWRFQVFKRDNWTCQCCGQNKIYVESHHIYGLCRIIEELSIKTREDAVACKELWDIGNGKTLCKKCHNLTKKRKKIA